MSGGKASFKKVRGTLTGNSPLQKLATICLADCVCALGCTGMRSFYGNTTSSYRQFFFEGRVGSFDCDCVIGPWFDVGSTNTTVS